VIRAFARGGTGISATFKKCAQKNVRHDALILLQQHEAAMSNAAESDAKTSPQCSFCGKRQHDVRKLVSGPQVFICDECVEVSMTLLRDPGESFYLRSPAEYRKLADDNVRSAEQAGVPRQKALNAVTRTWLRLAKEAEGR
jgi:ClpX C4-type zinc finger protein